MGLTWGSAYRHSKIDNALKRLAQSTVEERIPLLLDQPATMDSLLWLYCLRFASKDQLIDGLWPLLEYAPEQDWDALMSLHYQGDNALGLLEKRFPKDPQVLDVLYAMQQDAVEQQERDLVCYRRLQHLAQCQELYRSLEIFPQAYWLRAFLEDEFYRQTHPSYQLMYDILERLRLRDYPYPEMLHSVMLGDRRLSADDRASVLVHAQAYCDPSMAEDLTLICQGHRLPECAWFENWISTTNLQVMSLLDPLMRAMPKPFRVETVEMIQALGIPLGHIALAQALERWLIQEESSVLQLKAVDESLLPLLFDDQAVEEIANAVPSLTSHAIWHFVRSKRFDFTPEKAQGSATLSWYQKWSMPVMTQSKSQSTEFNPSHTKVS